MVVFDFLNSIKSLMKLDPVHTDNNVFKLHYRVTTLFLIVFSILLTSKQFFGDPIDCIIETGEKSLVNSFCWTHGTYINLNTIKMEYGILAGLGIINTSISPHDQRYPATRYSHNGFLTQKYYQWVCLFLIFKAFLFAVPRYLWKTWEAGQMKLLVSDISGPLVSSSWNEETKRKIINYLICRRYTNNTYALQYAFCELLNCLNVILQMYITDVFLSGYFIDYGLAILMPSDTNRMTLVFPKLAKCIYMKYGHSGTAQTFDALCLLPLNVVNEKIFAFLWFWYYILGIISLCQLLYRITSIASTTFREKTLRARCRYVTQNTCDILVNNFSYGEMFILEILAKNLNPIIYKDLLIEIAKELHVDHPIGGYKSETTMVV